MFQIEFDYDWPAGLRDIHVLKCGRRTQARTDGRLEIHPISSSRAFVYGKVEKQHNLKMLCAANYRVISLMVDSAGLPITKRI